MAPRKAARVPKVYSSSTTRSRASRVSSRQQPSPDPTSSSSSGGLRLIRSSRKNISTTLLSPALEPSPLAPKQLREVQIDESQDESDDIIGAETDRTGPIDINIDDSEEPLYEIRRFLVAEDREHCPTWERRYREIRDYLYNAEQSRKEGRLDASLHEVLSDCQRMCETHKKFEDWYYGITPWSSQIVQLPKTSTRLPKHPHLLTMTAASSMPEPKLQVLTRNDCAHHRPFDKLVDKKDGSPLTREPPTKHDVQYFGKHEDLYWKTDPGKASSKEIQSKNHFPGNSDNVNLFTEANKEYETCITNGPLKTALRAATVFDKVAVLPDWRRRARQRGWKRAALQQSLNVFKNIENAYAATPWRRVVLPHVPVANPGEQLVHALWMSKEKAAEHANEPIPFQIYYGEYRKQLERVAERTHQAIMAENVEDESRPALPWNFAGPVQLNGLNASDQKFYELARECWRVYLKLQRASRIAPRKAIHRILEMIEAGLNPKRAKPHDVWWRSDVDHDLDSGCPNIILKEELQWLRFVSGRSTNSSLNNQISPPIKMLQLFSARLQELFEDCSPECSFPDLDTQLDVKTLTAEINKHNEGPNTRYKFEQSEVMWCCERLADQGHIRYTKTFFEIGYAQRPVPDLHPENLITWRKNPFQDLRESFIQETGEEVYAEERHFSNKAPQTGDFEHKKQLPYEEDISTWDEIGWDDYCSDRTMHFLLAIAYRMGYSIQAAEAHFKDLGDRPKISYKAVEIALNKWVHKTRSGNIISLEETSKVEARLPTYRDVHEHAEPGKYVGNKTGKWFLERIRKGLIDDAVQNRTMLYLGRLTAPRGPNGEEEQKVRDEIWGWVPSLGREHEPQYRAQFFSLDRWPAKVDDKVSQNSPTTPLAQVIEPRDRGSMGLIKKLLHSIHASRVPQFNAAHEIWKESEIAQCLDENEEVVSTDQGPAVKELNLDELDQYSLEREVAQQLRQKAEEMMKCPISKPFKEPKSKFWSGPAMYLMGDTPAQQYVKSLELETMIDRSRNTEQQPKGRTSWLQRTAALPAAVQSLWTSSTAATYWKAAIDSTPNKSLPDISQKLIPRSSPMVRATNVVAEGIADETAMELKRRKRPREEPDDRILYPLASPAVKKRRLAKGKEKAA